MPGPVLATTIYLALAAGLNVAVYAAGGSAVNLGIGVAAALVCIITSISSKRCS